MIRDAVLSVPIGNEVLQIDCGILYNNDYGIELEGILECRFNNLSYYKFQELFKLMNCFKENRVKHFFELEIGKENMILCDLVIEELFRDKIVLNIGRVVINEV